MFMCAKDFAKSIGLPVETIRELCREGKLPNMQKGRVYYIHVEGAKAVILSLLNKPKQSRRRDYMKELNEL